jgi:hypothetical protein
MSLYRIVKHKTPCPTVAEHRGIKPLSTTIWSGEKLLDEIEQAELIRMSGGVEKRQRVVVEERNFVAELGRRSLEFSWRELPGGSPTPLPEAKYRILMKTQTKEAIPRSDGYTVQASEVEVPIWGGENLPTEKEWATSVAIASLERAYHASSYADESEIWDNPADPTLQKLRFIKYGSKVVNLGWKNIPSPAYEVSNVSQ